MKSSATLLILGLALLSGCATQVGPPTLPKMQPLQLNVSGSATNVQIVMPKVVAPQLGILPNIVNDAAAGAAGGGTDTLRKQMAAEQGQALTALFETELRQRFLRKGGVLAASKDSAGAPEIWLTNLSAVYLASTFASAYSPVAFVWMAASTDTSSNRPAGHIRTVEAKPASAATFMTSAAITSDPAKAYEGLRTAVIELAERVASQLAAAQKQG